MSRREEVEAKIISADGEYCDSAWIGPESLRHLARTLADEVDKLTAERDEWKRRAEAIVKMLDPGPEHPKWGHGICESCGWHGCFSSFVGRAGGELQDNDESLCPLCEDTVQDVDRSIYVNLHARAIAIAEGRDNG